MRATATTLTALALLTAGLAVAPTASAQQFCGEDGEPPETVDECLPDDLPCQEPLTCVPSPPCQTVDECSEPIRTLLSQADDACDRIVSTLHPTARCGLS